MKMPRALTASSLGVLALSVALSVGACREPTEIRLHIHTNLDCADRANWRGVSVHVGHPGAALETNAPTLNTSECNPGGQVGSLVIVPSASSNDEVGIVVVAGLASDPEDCALRGYRGCVVARRAVHFDPHTPVDLDVALNSDCTSVGCDPDHTCVAGSCSDQRSLVPIFSDGSSVRCGDNGIFCPSTGAVCCLTVDQDAGTSFGECKDPKLCPPTSIVLNCDDETDCAGERDDAGRPNVCVVISAPGPMNAIDAPGSVSASECSSYASFQATQLTLLLCENRQPCVDGAYLCGASMGDPKNPLPGYSWCEVQ